MSRIGSSVRDNVVSMARPVRHAGAAPADVPPREGARRDVADLSLPDAIARPLAVALKDVGFRFGRTDTKPGGHDNVTFHRVVGLNGSRPTSIALLYISDEELQRPRERWFVYSLCIRICKAQKSWDADLSSIVFLRPESVMLPGDWSQQIKDFKEIGAVANADEGDIPPPESWIDAAEDMGMHYARRWIKTAALSAIDPPSPSREPASVPARPVLDPAREPGALVQSPLVFVSYSSADEAQCKQLVDKLKPLERVFNVKDPVWVDAMTPVGSDWFSQIERNLDAARVVVMLVSTNFLNSDFIEKEEFQRALEAAERDQKTIVWVLGDSCAWEDSPLKRIQGVVKATTPLNLLTPGEVSQQLLNVYVKVRDLLRDKYNAPPRDR